MKICDITNCIEEFAPLMLQESYDNSGLIIGEKNTEISKALICLDVTEEIIDEAIAENFQLVISHHPVIFKGLKKINCKNAVERIIVKAIKNDIAIYAVHTNADNIIDGVNAVISKKLDLKNTRVLLPRKYLLKKIVTFCPVENADKVRNALFEAGAGFIGNYDSCSFNAKGTGSFKANEMANPHVGEINELHYEDEIRIETIYPVYKEQKILKNLFNAHPYEEVAYDIYTLDNEFNRVGAGIIGELQKPTDELELLKKIKKIVKTDCIKHSDLLSKKIKKVALCGGSGSFLISNAINADADIFITADVKYHEFFEADNKILIADIGHFESEQFIKQLIYAVIIKKFPNFALRISEKNTNSINYLL